MKQTSKEGEAFIKPHKQNHKNKIVEGLERLRIGGTQEELALVTGLRPDQVWKRMIDLQKDELVFDTGIKRKLRSGVNGIVWQLKGRKVVGASTFPQTQRQQNVVNTLKQLSFYDR